MSGYNYFIKQNLKLIYKPTSIRAIIASNAVADFAAGIHMGLVAVCWLDWKIFFNNYKIILTLRIFKYSKTCKNNRNYMLNDI